MPSLHHTMMAAGLSLLLAGCAGRHQDAAPGPDAAASPTRQLTPAEGKVAVHRDPWGTAHVYAAREEDGFFGVGYATAEDRLHQLLLHYLLISGRLAEKFGPGTVDFSTVSPQFGAGTSVVPDTVESDRWVRQYRLLAGARENLPRLPPQVRADVEAYVAGIRRYMEEHPERVPAWGEVPDAAHVVALDMRFYLLYFGIVSGAELCAGKPERTASAGDDAAARMVAGSNGWVLGPQRTAGGHAIHLSDSHGPIDYLGTFFYSWRVKAGSYDFLAFGPAGSPFALFGHSPHFSWGWTDYRNRVSDCYAVTVSEADPRSYLFDGEPARMEVEPYEIKVLGRDPVRGEFEYTRHNGVRSPVVRRDGRTAFAVSSPYMDREGFSMDTFRSMALARDGAEFRQALATQELFPNNLLAGGRDGTFLYVKTGREPVRPAGIDGTAVLDGNSSATAWRGIQPFEALMRAENPAVGFVANNNVSPDRIFPDSPLQAGRYPASYVIDGSTNTRQLRAIELLGQATGTTVPQAIAYAMDAKVYGADLWAPAFAAAAAAHPGAVAAKGGEFREFLAELSRFDGFFVKASRAALYHLETRRALVGGFPGEVDAVSEAIEGGRPLTEAQGKVLLDAAAAAFDGIRAVHRTTAVTFGDVHRLGRGDRLLPADGVAFLSGFNRSHSWGEFGNPPRRIALAASLNVLRFDFDQPSPTGRRVAVGGRRTPFLTVLSEPVQSFSAFAFGLSDDPASPRYANQTGVWSDNALKPTYFNAAELAGNTASTLVLDVPRR